MSVYPANPAMAPVSSKTPSTNKSVDVQKHMDSLQEEWATKFTHLEELLTLSTRNLEKPFFSLVKVQVPHSSTCVPILNTPFLVPVQ